MIYIGLGSNLRGAYTDSLALVQAAIEAFASIDVEVLDCSRFYRSGAVGPGEQPDYVNAVVAIETGLSPLALLEALQGLERQFGRDRQHTQRWGARTLDLDILDYRGQVAAHPHLPHPRMQDRAFVLKPLQDIAPAWVHPVLGQSLADLLEGIAPDNDCTPIPLDSPNKIG